MTSVVPLLDVTCWARECYDCILRNPMISGARVGQRLFASREANTMFCVSRRISRNGQQCRRNCDFCL